MISIKIEDIIYDVENFAFVEGDLMPDGSAADAHAAHLVFDIGKDGNQDLARRSMRLAHLEVIDALYPYAGHPLGGRSSLTTPAGQKGLISFSLRLPDGAASHTPRLVKELARQYVTARILRDWMMVVKPEAVPRWQARIEELSRQLRSAVSARLRPLRRKISPF